MRASQSKLTETLNLIFLQMSTFQFIIFIIIRFLL